MFDFLNIPIKTLMRLIGLFYTSNWVRMLMVVSVRFKFQSYTSINGLCFQVEYIFTKLISDRFVVYSKGDLHLRAI